MDSSILTFINHGCNGTYNVDFGSSISARESDYITEQNASMEDKKNNQVKMYDPLTDRRDVGGWGTIDVALRDIAAGEEILCNYVFFTDNDEAWLKEVNVLKKICNGEEVGLIVQSEMQHMRKKVAKATSTSSSRGEEL